MADFNLKFIIDAVDNASAVLDKTKNSMASLQKAGDAMVGAGTSLTIMTAPLALGLVGATKAAIDFESSFAGIKKTMTLSDPEFAKLSNNIRQLSKEIPVSVNELNKIGELGGQLGVTGVADLEKFIDTISKIGVTTNLTVEEAAIQFAQLANIMQIPLTEVDKLASSIVDLGNNFATTEADISAFASKLAPAANAVGLTTDEVLGMSAAFASVGIEAGLGSTAIQKALFSMNDAIVLGNSDLAVYADTLGITEEAFGTLFDSDPAEAFLQFTERLAEQGNEAKVVLDELSLSDARVAKSLLAIAGSGDILSDSLDVSAEAWAKNVALNEEAAKRFETTASQIQLMKNRFNDLGITIGEVILPIILKFIDIISPAIEGLAKGFRSLPVAFRVILVAVTALVVALGPLLIMLGFAAKAFVALKVGAVALKPVLVGLKTSLVSISPILIAIIVVIGLLTLAWKKGFFGIKEETKQVFHEIGKTIQFAIGLIVYMFNFMIEALEPIMTSFSQMFGIMGAKTSAESESMSQSIARNFEIVRRSLLILAQVFNAVVTVVIAGVRTIGTVLGTMARVGSIAFGGFIEVISSAANSIPELWKSIQRNFGIAAFNITRIMSNLVVNTQKAFANLFTTDDADLNMDLTAGTINFQTGAFDDVKETIKNTLKEIETEMTLGMADIDVANQDIMASINAIGQDVDIPEIDLFSEGIAKLKEDAGGGGGGGGRNKAAEEAAAAAEELLKKQEEFIEKQSELADTIDNVTDSYEQFKDSAITAIESVARETTAALDELDVQAADLNASITDIKDQISEGQQVDGTTLAAAYVEQEQAVAALGQELENLNSIKSEDQDLDKIAKVKEELDKELDALSAFGDRAVELEEQIIEARRVANLTDFARSVENVDNAAELREAILKEELSALEIQLEAIQNQKDEIKRFQEEAEASISALAINGTTVYQDFMNSLSAATFDTVEDIEGAFATLENLMAGAGSVEATLGTTQSDIAATTLADTQQAGTTENNFQNSINIDLRIDTIDQLEQRLSDEMEGVVLDVVRKTNLSSV